MAADESFMPLMTARLPWRSYLYVMASRAATV